MIKRTEMEMEMTVEMDVERDVNVGKGRKWIRMEQTVALET